MSETISEKAIVDSYARLKSVWKVGEELQLSGQRVHQILRRLGHVLKQPEFTEAQKEQIREYYLKTPAATFALAPLAEALGKSRQNIARTARRMGLTKQGRPLNEAVLAKVRGKPRWLDKPHPRGMAGKKHSEETKKRISYTSKRAWATHQTFGGSLGSEEWKNKVSLGSSRAQAARAPHVSYSRTKGGHRSDLENIYFRSSWEANYARYLNLLKRLGIVESWEFEPETFWFEGVKRGTVSYKPDFRVKYKNDPKLEYVEIKGWIVPKDYLKWKRMAKYHPHIKLVIVKAKEYYALQKKWASSIPEWEDPKKASQVTVKPLEAA